MSYGLPIGFRINPKNVKGPMVPMTAMEKEIFFRMGVPPIFHDLKKMLPEGNKEPEPKLIVPGSRSFKQIRNLICALDGSFLIPGQIHDKKQPLTSVLMDTFQNRFPTALLDHLNYTLRYRFSIDPKTGLITQGDFNEKSGMIGASMFGGCADRFEREFEQEPDQSIKEAYYAFVEEYRRNNDPAMCDKIAFEQLRTAAGYQASRNEIGFAVKHPHYNTLFVFEGCEDFWHSLAGDMSEVTAKLYEFEFEAKQVWGELPPHVNTKEQFKLFLYETMTHFVRFLHANVPGSYINEKSKAEISKEQLSNVFGFDKLSFEHMGLKEQFQRRTKLGKYDGISPLQCSLTTSGNLEETMLAAYSAIRHNAGQLDHEKERYNKDKKTMKPDMAHIGTGNRALMFDNDNAGRRGPIPVATIR